MNFKKFLPFIILIIALIVFKEIGLFQIIKSDKGGQNVQI